MGLFGDQDAADVPDNPFYVAPDVYSCTLAEATRNEKNDGSGEGISFKWVVTDDESDYHGSNISDWHNIYPEVNESDLEDMGQQERANVRRDRARLRGRLKQMEITDEEQDTLLDGDNLENLIGMTADVEVFEQKDRNDPEKKYSNIKRVFNVERD